MADTSEPPAGVEADASPSPGRRPPRPPSLLDALLPVIVLIGLLALTIAFFGIDATNGARWSASSRCAPWPIRCTQESSAAPPPTR